jgi:hypothetical protein
LTAKAALVGFGSDTRTYQNHIYREVDHLKSLRSVEINVRYIFLIYFTVMCNSLTSRSYMSNSSRT